MNKRLASTVTRVRPISHPLLAGLAVAAMLALAAGCVPPSPTSGTVMVPGTSYSGRFSHAAPVAYLIDGSAGDLVTVQATYMLTAFETVPAVVTVYGPGGVYPAIVRTAGSSQTYELPVTGRFTVELRPGGAPSLDYFTYTIIAAFDQDLGPVTLGLLANPAVNGQMLSWTYGGTAGETLNAYRAAVRDPLGVEVPPNGVFDGQVTLPVDGTYRIEVTQSGAALTKDLVGGAIGLGQTVTPGMINDQHIAYTYAGSAGEALGIANGAYRLIAPGGAVLVAETSRTTRAVLPVSGDYTIILRRLQFGPADIQPLTVWLSHDLDAGAITTGITPMPAGLEPGQSASWVYAGTAGEELRVRTVWFGTSSPNCANEFGPGGYPNVSQAVFAPDGSNPCSSTFSDGTTTWFVYDLPVTGAYRVVITPQTPTAATDVGVQSFPA